MKARLPLICCAAILLCAMAADAHAQQQRAATSRLRDITVAISGDHATITLLVNRGVATVVTETVGGNAQVRMRPVAADRATLKSARLRNGVRSARAHIERRDVLVVNVDFERAVVGMRVIRRTDEAVVVDVELDASKSSSAGAKPSVSARKKSRRHARWALSTIVIDAGHGGKDPGATGIGGVIEKTVTLAIAKQLRSELRRRMPGVRVVMTRTADQFVELFRRGQIANESDGRLFISIHCNAVPDSAGPINGFECYILRPGKSEEAALVVAAENDVIRYEADRAKYDAMSAESAIVASMAQSAFARYSEQAAQSIRTSMKASVKLNDRGVHQAGFFVLVGASMPAVLIETGYLSSKRDVRTLRTAAGRKTIAAAIARGIVRYEKIYSATLE